MTKVLKERKDMDSTYMWDLSSLYESDEAWEKAIEAFKPEIDKISSFEGKLNNAENILNYYQLLTASDRTLSDLFCYANLRYSEDVTNEKAQAMYSRVYALAVKLSTANSFAEPEIISLDESTLNEIATNPIMKDYEVILKRVIKQKPHTLSGKEEAIISSLGEVLNASGKIANDLMDADLVYEPVKDKDNIAHELNGSNFIQLQMSNDRELRKNAFHSYYNSYKQHNTTFANTYSTCVKAEVQQAQLRNFASTREMSLEYNEIPLAVYDTLIATVRKHLPTMYRYERLRKRLLGIDDLHYYDLYAPLNVGNDKEYSYEEAKEMVLKTVSVLGEDYKDVVKRAFDENWIDVYPNKGKTGGAFSSGTYDSNPYILLNYTEGLDDVSTLIHEMGHSLHTYHSNTHQPPQYSGYTMFVAEVASTVNENLLIEQLLKECEDPQAKLNLLNQYLEGFKGTIYRQTMFAEFEMRAHKAAEEGEALNASYLNNLYAELIKDYFGDELVFDDEVQYEWSRIPHFYRPFYVYGYATGYSAAVALSEAILNEGDSAVKRYREFLSMGSSKTPVEELAHAGVDLSKPDYLDAALNKFAEVVEEAEKVADQLGK